MMRRTLFIFFLTLFSSSAALASGQEPDILIIEKDTFYLKSFPLENLKINKKTIIRPFDNDGKLGKISTGCWRGYVATWKIIDSLLFLIKVENFFTKEKLNILKYLKNNGYNPKIINGFVLADWYSDSLKKYEFPFASAEDNKFNLCNNELSKNIFKKIELEFENGKLIQNNILPIEAYLIGHKLSYYYSKSWIAGVCGVTIHGIIRENNGKMVRLEISTFTVNGQDITEQIDKKTIKDFENFWINPRYCEKNE